MKTYNINLTVKVENPDDIKHVVPCIEDGMEFSAHEGVQDVVITEGAEPEVWFCVVEWPDETFGDEGRTEISHFSSKELCEDSLKEYLKDTFERSFYTIDHALEEAHDRGLKVWYAKAKIRKV